MKHFFIIFVIIKWYYRDTIINLESEWINWIIHDYNVFKVSYQTRFLIQDLTGTCWAEKSRCENTQIFYVVALFGKETMLPVQPMCDKLVIWVYVIKDSISIHLMTSSEYYDLEVLVGFF